MREASKNAVAVMNICDHANHGKRLWLCKMDIFQLSRIIIRAYAVLCEAKVPGRLRLQECTHLYKRK